MTDFEIIGFQKTQKSKHLGNETFFFFEIKKSLITHHRLLCGKKKFCNGGN